MLSAIQPTRSPWSPRVRDSACLAAIILVLAVIYVLASFICVQLLPTRSSAQAAPQAATQPEHARWWLEDTVLVTRELGVQVIVERRTGRRFLVSTSEQGMAMLEITVPEQPAPAAKPAAKPLPPTGPAPQ